MTLQLQRRSYDDDHDCVLQTEKIVRLANHLDKCVVNNNYNGGDPISHKTFRMSNVVYSCGSPACIAGHACALELSEPPSNMISMDWAGLQLGLSRYKQDLLFHPTLPYAHYRAQEREAGFISPKRAAGCLRLLAETGEVLWHCVDLNGKITAPETKTETKEDKSE